MERQLKAAGHGEQVCYKADGIIKAMLERSELEILILETSNALDATTPTKRAFDFHKAMFGAVAMLKSIADKYKYADFSVFSALKIYFLHVAGKLMRYSQGYFADKRILDAEIRLWSVQNFQKKIFLVVREKKSGVPSSEDDEDTLFAYIEFFWILKVSEYSSMSVNVFLYIH